MDEEQIRLYFHNILTTLFPGFGIYYRPPGNEIFTRPCIIYDTLQAEPSYANNSSYVVGTRFQVTVLSDIPGVQGLRAMFGYQGLSVRSHRSFVKEDIANDVFVISVNTL